MKARKHSKVWRELQLSRKRNLCELKRATREYNQFLFYWVAVNNAIQDMKKAKKKMTFLSRGEALEDGMGWPRGTVENHPPTEECDEPECWVCGFRDCPYGEPLHYDKDGCPACPRPKRDGPQVTVSDFDDFIEE